MRTNGERTTCYSNQDPCIFRYHNDIIAIDASLRIGHFNDSKIKINTSFNNINVNYWYNNNDSNNNILFGIVIMIYYAIRLLFGNLIGSCRCYLYSKSMIACGYIHLQHIRSKSNIADLLSKHWGYQSSYDLIRPIFHHAGNTASLYIDDTLEVDCYTNNITNFIYGDLTTDGEYEKEDSPSPSLIVKEDSNSPSLMEVLEENSAVATMSQMTGTEVLQGQTRSANRSSRATSETVFDT